MKKFDNIKYNKKTKDLTFEFKNESVWIWTSDKSEAFKNNKAFKEFNKYYYILLVNSGDYIRRGEIHGEPTQHEQLDAIAHFVTRCPDFPIVRTKNYSTEVIGGGFDND